MLLKLASKANGIPVVAFFNVNKRGKRIKDKVRLEDLPYRMEKDSLMYYKVISQEHGYYENLEVELEENGVEIVVLARRGTPIGLKEFLLPPATLREGKPITSGTLIILTSP